MKKNVVIVLMVVGLVVFSALGWWFSTHTNSVTILNPANLAVSNNGGGHKSQEKQIISFQFPEADGGISAAFDNEKNIITFTIPSEVDITKIAPVISVSEKATISPGSGIVQDFSSPVSYTVTAEDGSTKIYTIIVNTIAPQGPVQGS